MLAVTQRYGVKIAEDTEVLEWLKKNDYRLFENSVSRRDAWKLFRDETDTICGYQRLIRLAFDVCKWFAVIRYVPFPEHNVLEEHEWIDINWWLRNRTEEFERCKTPAQVARLMLHDHVKASPAILEVSILFQKMWKERETNGT